MRMFPITLVPLALLAGCEDPAARDSAPVPGATTVAEPEPAATQAPADARAVETLAGGWRVAGIDGEAFDETYGLALYGTDRLLYWEPDCAGQERRYVIDGTSFSASVPPSDGPRIVCDIGLPDRLPDVWAAVDMATTIERLPDNSVRLSGGGRSLTLFSQ